MRYNSKEFARKNSKFLNILVLIFFNISLFHKAYFGGRAEIIKRLKNQSDSKSHFDSSFMYQRRFFVLFYFILMSEGEALI